VIIAKFQWVGVVDSTNLTESASPPDHATATTAERDDSATSAPSMQYFIKVVLHFMPLP